MLDIFRNNAFTVTSMSDAMREVKFIPGLIGRMNLYQSTSISTTSIAIEKKADNSLIIVPSAPRGAPGVTTDKVKRSLRNLTIPHFPAEDAIYADEVQDVRAFGEEVALEMLAGKIAERAVSHSNNFAITEEYHRLKVITDGKLLDSDGSTLINYFTEMGESQASEVDFDLDNATPASGALRKACTALTRSMANSLDGLPYTSIVGFCGDAFFDDLMAHPEVRDTYKGYDAAAELRRAYIGDGAGGAFGMYEFGGIVWINYRGTFNGSAAVGTDKVHFAPMGTPGLFRTVYGPADYIETVNRPGQRLYAKQWEMPNGKGVNLEFQMNAIHYVTRPRVLLRGKRT